MELEQRPGTLVASDSSDRWLARSFADWLVTWECCPFTIFRIAGRTSSCSDRRVSSPSMGEFSASDDWALHRRLDRICPGPYEWPFHDVQPGIGFVAPDDPEHPSPRADPARHSLVWDRRTGQTLLDHPRGFLPDLSQYDARDPFDRSSVAGNGKGLWAQPLGPADACHPARRPAFDPSRVTLRVRNHVAYTDRG